MKANRKAFGPISAFGPAVVLVLLVVAGFAQAATWNVPGDSATIQGGIDLASYGDTVQVAAGTYTELITLKNGVALIGVGASTTTIDGNLSDSVITSTSCDPNTILDGFTITNGDATFGGGMYNSSSSPTVTNCTFTDNSASDGGGIYNDGGSPTVTNCTFRYHMASNDGAGMYNYLSSPTVTNCTFTENWADDYGGGMYNYYRSPTVTNCTFTYNDARGGGGMYNNTSSTPTVTNCIFWGNVGEIYNNDFSTPAVISYCDIEGCGGSGAWDSSFGTDGGGNIDTDPLFVSFSDLHLQGGSPCINAGDNGSVPEGITTDQDGLPRIINLVVDMGAYESQDLVVICVDTNAAGANNGLNWPNAFNYLQDGLAAADYGDSILVAEGTYRPDEDTADPTGTGVRRDTFALISGAALYGGFPSGGSDFANRNPNQYETILSGDLLENDGPDFANNDENSYHVVTARVIDPNAVLDGFTITGGNANGSDPDDDGGGMYNVIGSPTVVNCTFTGNSAEYGGGMFNDYSSPRVTNCTFSDNLAVGGGGMFNDNGSPIVTNCRLSGNSSQYGGSGMYNLSSAPRLTNCTFSGNSALTSCAGMYNWSSSPTLTNCTFSGNSAVDVGGGMYSSANSTPLLSNCIFWGNSDSGGTDESAQIHNSNSTPVVNYCCVQGWTGDMGGEGNIGDDPLFKDADGDDDVVGTADDNLQLAYDSPCIDAGNSNSVPPDYADLDEDGDTAEQMPLDLAGRARFTDDPVMADTGTGTPPIVDMGAYERYEFCGSEAYPHRLGDANQDCRFDLADIAIIALQWLDYYGPV